MAGARPVNSYSPLALVSVERMKLPAASKQIDPHAFEQNFRFVEVAIFVLVGMHSAADRAGQQLAEVVFHRMIAEVEYRAEDAIHAAGRFVGRRAAVAAGRVLAVEPAGRLNFAHAVRARKQIAKFVEAERSWIGRRRRRDAGGVAVGIEQLERHAADALFGAAIEHAVVAAVVIDPAGQRGQRNLCGMGDRAGRAVGVVVRGRIRVVGQAEREAGRGCSQRRTRRRTRPNRCP